MWRKNRPGTGENIACEQARESRKVSFLCVAKLGLTHGRTEAGLEAPKCSLSIWFIARLFLSCVI